ncbi:MAG: hypothetical protein ACOX1U_03020 [Saccharofermentanales bacterium]|jgi:hypothetical protein|nr:hypothetical protein [Clostridiaceae bacterium]
MRDMIELKAELDKLMCGLGGVLAAKTVFGDGGEIIEIHILSDLTKTPKQLVRDIQSAVMATFGLEIDYRLISVAQINNSMITSAIASEPRIIIHRILISLEAGNLETTVTLGRGDQTFTGSCKGPSVGRNRAYAAAAACMDALRTCMGPLYSISLLDLQRTMLAGEDCIAAALSFVEPDRETTLYGIAPIKSPETEVQAVVMAVLSAVNRLITKSRKN